MKKSKAYLFDFDGTLVDTMGGYADIAASVINKYHPEISFEKARKSYLDTSGIPFFQQLEIILPGDPTNAEKAGLFEESKKEGFFRETFSADVRSTINGLRKRNIIAGVSSNNFQELVDKFVEREGLDFDVVLGYRDGFSKGKQHFEYVMKKFSLSRKDLTFVGDSMKDAEKAIDSKVNFIGLCGTFSRSDFYSIDKNIIAIDNIKELLDL